MKTLTPNIEVINDHRSLLGEGPVWDADIKAIFWVDILQGEIHEYNTTDKIHSIIPVHKKVGAIALSTHGKLLAALNDGIVMVDKKDHSVIKIAHPEKDIAGNRYNDGKCDPAGRFWIGSMAFDESKGAGNLHMLNADGSHDYKIKGVTISNGMAWSANKKEFYYIDSPSMKVVKYDYEIDTGEISNMTVVIEINEAEGTPDGMTMDTEGMLWIAHWDGWQVARWNPLTGEKLFTIKLPVARITSCTFGGDKLNDLFITTASVGLSDIQKKDQPLAGALFVARNIGFTGTLPHKFLIQEQ